MYLQVACTLFYSDVNVAQPERGSPIRLCKTSWSDTSEFNKVAYEVGSGEYKIIPEIQEVRGSSGRAAHLSHRFCHCRSGNCPYSCNVAYYAKSAALGL
jgi:hypothetical protein